MKVIPDPTIMGFSGKWPGSKLVMSHRPGKRVVSARQYVKPNNLTQQVAFTAKLAAIAAAWQAAQAGFRADAKTYSTSYNSSVVSEDKLPVSGYSLFVKGCCDTAKVSAFDLTTLTTANFATCTGEADISFKAFIDAEVLPNLLPDKADWVNIVAA